MPDADGEGRGSEQDVTPQEGHTEPPDSIRRLGALVGAEAHRVLSEAQIQADPARLAAGWRRRFVTDATRAAEAVDLYEQLGFEAVADPLDAKELGEQCDDCRLLALLRFRTVYTRQKDANDLATP